MYDIFEQLLKMKHLRPIDVSRATGVPLSTLTDWKKGRYTPKVDKRKKIADYLGVSLDYLDTGKNTEKVSSSGKTYYFDDDAAEFAEFLHKNPAYRVLFDASRNVAVEDIDFVRQMIDRMSGHDG